MKAKGVEQCAGYPRREQKLKQGLGRVCHHQAEHGWDAYAERHTEGRTSSSRDQLKAFVKGSEQNALQASSNADNVLSNVENSEIDSKRQRARHSNRN